MNKKIGSILLISGTCIGSGMIALPMVLSKLGIIPSILLIFAIWFVMYFTSLINIELNLQADKGLPLGDLGNIFSGKFASFIGYLAIKLLSYSLLSVFIYAGSSILTKLISSGFSDANMQISYSIFALIILMLPIRKLDYFNRILFIALVIIVLILIFGIFFSINYSNLPLISPEYNKLSSWQVAIPVLFTSFGFQVIFHTLTNYCGKDKYILKSAFFWGSLIPTFVYLFWTFSILSVIYDKNPEIYNQITQGKIDVGDLIQELSLISKFPSIQLLTWWISLLAIFTSIVGVGVGLSDSYKKIFETKFTSSFFNNFLSAFLTILPAYLIASNIPNAFIKLLAFAGMILTIIAIFLPIYLLMKIYQKDFFYSEIKNLFLIFISIIAGIIIVICEFLNIFL